MAAAACLAVALWLLLFPVGVAGAGPPPIQDGEFTFLLPAGRKQCFYQSAPANASLETEYQVIGGAGLDVDFTLESPQGVLLVSDSRKADGMHTVEPTEAGDYKLCFDNSFSTISEKLVFFELIFDSLQDDEEVEGWAEAVEPEEMLDVKMEDIKESIETMRSRLERTCVSTALCGIRLGKQILAFAVWSPILDHGGKGLLVLGAGKETQLQSCCQDSCFIQ
ncbi:transmembrane emp24 domain-containing protein 1 isoform X2 [Nycticebus coucang]|uniref:transmembrane emp24 domain-containing protein 1 isoform X2 n=1 Tax=Nycticebus coucang TaxID=9470 RepID=UPI00234C46B2|nr:transmembrane emp24 domain-containing protein 1 isoform X2 [Nycticebus coucang]